MRPTSLIATAAAALLASTVLASAQELQKQGPGGGAMEHGAQQGQEHSPRGPTGGHERGAQHPRHNAQGAQQELKGTVGQGGRAEPKAHASEPKVNRGEQTNEPRTSGQGQEHSPQAGHEEEHGAPKAHQGGQKSEPRTQGQRTGAGSAVTLTNEQRTHIRQTVLRGSHAPRVDKVTFSISVGTVVPRDVRVVTVPRVIVDVHPRWRGYLYFVYEDEIIIVDHNHHIVAILNV